MGDQTPGTLELNCPGCGAYFRLKPKKGRLPEGPIPCPKCRTPIPIVAQEAAEVEAAARAMEAGEPVNKTMMGGISGSGASQDRQQKRRDDDSLPGFGGPLNPLAAMLQDDGVGPNSTFLGFQKLPFVEGSTRVINPDEMIPEAEIQPDNPFSKDKRGSTTDTSRFLKEEMAAERGDQPIAPHLRNTRENIVVSDQLPSLFEDDEEEESLGQMLSQARVTPTAQAEHGALAELAQVTDAEAGPFDLRDILEAEKHRVGETNAQEVTRNPLLEKNFMPEPEAEKPRENPWSRSSSQTLDDLMGEVDTNKRQSGAVKAVSKPAAPATPDGSPVQLAKLKLGLRRAKEAEVRETSERSSSGAFGRAVSNNDVFSESSSVAQDESASPQAMGIFKPHTARAESADPDRSGERLASPSRTADELPIFGMRGDATRESAEEAPQQSKRTLPLTPVMPAPAVMPTGALPESEQEGSAPRGQSMSDWPAAHEAQRGQAAPRLDLIGAPAPEEARMPEAPAAEAAPEPKKEKAPPLAALLKRKINADKLKALGDGLGETSSAASDDSAFPRIERPADNSPGFETSIAEVLRRTEEGLAKPPVEEADAAQTVEGSLNADAAPTVLTRTEEQAGEPLVEPAVEPTRAPSRVVDAFKTAPMRPDRAEDEPVKEEAAKPEEPAKPAVPVKPLAIPRPAEPSKPSLGDAPSKPSLSLPAADPLRTSGVLGSLKRKMAGQADKSSEELVAGVAPQQAQQGSLASAAVKTTSPHRPLPSMGTGEQPVLQIPASLAGLPNLSSGDNSRGKTRARQSTEPMFPVAPSGLLSIQPPSQQPTGQQGGAGSMNIGVGSGLGNEQSAGFASERRGSGYIRLPTSEILEVLGQGSYRIMVEDIVYEPVDEQGLTELIKRGVLLGAEQIAEADGDWMPIGEHPVFRRLRRRMALEAHALLAKYRKASEERNKREREGKASDDELIDLLGEDENEGSAPDALPNFTKPDAAESSESDDDLDLWGGAKVLEESAPDHAALRGVEEIAGAVEKPDTAVIEFPSHIDSSGTMPRAAEPAVEGEAEAESAPALIAAPPVAEPEPAQREEQVEEVEPAVEPQAVAAVEPEPVKAPEPAPVKAQPAPEAPAKPAKPAKPAREEEPAKPRSRGTLVLALVGLALIALVAVALLVPGVRALVMGGGAAVTQPEPVKEPVAVNPEPVKEPVQEPVKAEADQGVAAQANNGAPKEPVVAPEPVKEPAAGGELASRWAAKPADGALALQLAEAQQRAGEHAAARRTLLGALAAGAPERDALAGKFRESLSAADMKQVEAKRLEPGAAFDGALAQRLYGRVAVELRKGSEPVGMFFPDVLDEPGNWRAQLAAARLCRALGCPVRLPEIEPAFITDADLRKLKGAVTEKQADTDELDWNGQKVEGVEGRPDVLRGVLVRWSAGQAAWPTEAANVWRPWLDPATDMAELGASLKEALGGLERYQGGVWFEPGKAAAGEASVLSFARGVAGMLLLDYLIGNWERYARPDQGINAAIEGGELVSLYQGTAFPARTSSRVKGRFDYFSRYDAAMVEGLRQVSPELLDEVLFPEASGAERAGLRVFWERREDALKRIDAQIKKYGAEKVLFGAP